MKRIAAPMVGRIGTSFILELLVYPGIYAVWRERHLNQELENHSLEASGFVGPIPPCRAPDPSDTLKLSGLPCFRVGLPIAATQLNHPQRCCSLVRK